MNSSKVNDLMRQKSNITSRKSNVESQMALLNTRIQRLQTASNELSNEIAILSGKKNSAENLYVDESRWKGTKKNKFTEIYETYKQSVRDYLSKAEDKKVQLDEEIAHAASTMGSYQSSLSSLSSQMSSLNKQITKAKKEEG